MRKYRYIGTVVPFFQELRPESIVIVLTFKTAYIALQLPPHDIALDAYLLLTREKNSATFSSRLQFERVGGRRETQKAE
jgi:hypothetical protein